MAGFDGAVFVDYLGSDDFIANSRQWDVVWPDGDMWNNDDHSGHRFARMIATSGLFDE
jgi:hypothetical protein